MIDCEVGKLYNSPINADRPVWCEAGEHWVSPCEYVQMVGKMVVCDSTFCVENAYKMQGLSKCGGRDEYS